MTMFPVSAVPTAVPIMASYTAADGPRKADSALPAEISYGEWRIQLVAVDPENEKVNQREQGGLIPSSR